METRSVQHAKEIMDVLKRQYAGIRVMGVGGAFGFVDRLDSGRVSTGDEDDFEEEDDEEEDLDEDEAAHMMLAVKSQSRRPSKQFSMHEIALS